MSKKKAGNLKARLVARGDQDQGEEDIPCDSPTVDRSTVQLMLAIAANEGWGLRSIDISATFLQGRQIDRIMGVAPGTLKTYVRTTSSNNNIYLICNSLLYQYNSHK